MKVDILIPTSLSDITLEQYQKFLKLDNDENKNSSFLLHKMIEIFCDLDLKDIAKIKFSSVKNVTKELDNIFAQKPKLKEAFILDGKEFGFIPILDEISLGEYVDLDQTLSNWQEMHKAMAVLYRPVTHRDKNRYLIEEYKGDLYAEKMKKAPLDAVFEEGNESGNEYSAQANFGRKWNWYQSIYGLAQGDVTRFDNITELGLFKCLTYLAFEKEKLQLEKNLIKRK